MMKKLLVLWMVATVSVVVWAQDDDITLPITEDVIYRVVPADTVDGIGALFDVSPTCIAESNQLTNNRILIGQELTISIACPRYGEDPRDRVEREVVIPRAVSEFVDTCTGYRVELNDSLETIAFSYDISVVSLALANEIDLYDPLDVSTCLIIPDDAPPYGEFPSLNVPALAGSDGQGGGLPEDAKTHIVQPRQSLSIIAELYDVDVTCLAASNLLTRPALLQPGDELFIDETCPPYSPFGMPPASMIATPTPATTGQ